MAAQTVQARRSGVPVDQNLADLTQGLPADAGTERALVANLVRIIYENELLVAMKPTDAYDVFVNDCRQGRDRP